jgi:hypothetical protein
LEEVEERLMEEGVQAVAPQVLISIYFSAA